MKHEQVDFYFTLSNINIISQNLENGDDVIVFMLKLI